MSQETNITPDDLSEEAKEAIHQTRNAQQAVELAREVQNKQLVEDTALRTRDSVLEGLKEIFSDDAKDPGKMTVLTQRVPLLCQNVEQTHKEIGEINTKLDKLSDLIDRKYVTIEKFTPTQLIAYGLVGLLGTAAVAALVSKIIS